MSNKSVDDMHTYTCVVSISSVTTQLKNRSMGPELIGKLQSHYTNILNITSPLRANKPTPS